MNTLFDNDMRHLTDVELVYMISNRQLKEEYNTFEELMELLTPGRRQVAEAAIEYYNRKKAIQHLKINGPRDIYEYMQDIFCNLKVEECWCIFLNQSAKIIKRQRISKGGLASTAVDIRCVLKEALLCGATSMALTHNHPSGGTIPSREDDRLTDQLSSASKVMNIKLVDHVIYGGENYYSYCDSGRI